VYVCVCRCMYACMHMNACVCICMYVHVFIHAHIVWVSRHGAVCAWDMETGRGVDCQRVSGSLSPPPPPPPPPRYARSPVAAGPGPRAVEASEDWYFNTLFRPNSEIGFPPRYIRLLEGGVLVSLVGLAFGFSLCLFVFLSLSLPSCRPLFFSLGLVRLIIGCCKQ
jgi:hypothetical protein